MIGFVGNQRKFEEITTKFLDYLVSGLLFGGCTFCEQLTSNVMTLSLMVKPLKETPAGLRSKLVVFGLVVPSILVCAL